MSGTKTKAIHSICFSPNEKILASASADTKIRLLPQRNVYRY
ncbi:WD40 repeat domain-containing protein [Leptolyngbya sp. 7M]